MIDVAYLVRGDFAELWRFLLRVNRLEVDLELFVRGSRFLQSIREILTFLIRFDGRVRSRVLQREGEDLRRREPSVRLPLRTAEE